MRGARARFRPLNRPPIIPGLGQPPWVQGIDFRHDPFYVSDPSGYDPEIGQGPNYPRTTLEGHVVGWEVLEGSTRDRSKSVDPRLAGVAFATNEPPTTATYRIDAPPGRYSLHLALGDAAVKQAQTCSLYDNETHFATVCDNVLTQAGHFVDAMGNVWTSAEWPGANVARGVILEQGPLRIVIGKLAVTAAATTIATVYLTSGA